MPLGVVVFFCPDKQGRRPAALPMDETTSEAQHVAKVFIARYGTKATFQAWTQLEMRISKEDDTAAFWMEVVTLLLDWQKPRPEAVDSIH